MSVDLSAAKAIVRSFLGEDVDIQSHMELHGDYLFLAIRNDPLEGHLDPFVKVNKETGDFIDFSPQDYPNPIAIINGLTEDL